MSIDAIDREYADLQEAAAILGVHPVSVRRYIRQGRLKSTTFANKYLIRRRDLEALRADGVGVPGPHRRQEDRRRYDALRAIREYIASEGHAPTHAEIAEELGCSDSWAWTLVKELECEGVITVTYGKRRSIHLTEVPA